MASKPLVLHRLAEKEASAAARWYRRRDVRVAVRFAEAVEQTLETVGRQPELFQANAAGERRFQVVGFPYIVVYCELPTFWLVLAIAHGKRRSGYWRRRAKHP